MTSLDNLEIELPKLIASHQALMLECDTLKMGWQMECELRLEQVENLRQTALGYKTELAATKATMKALKDAVGLVCEGWTLPADVRKILEAAVYENV